MNPSGDNSDRLYHGLIQIPGVESDLVRISGVVNHPITVPATVPSAGAPLRLGYEDDNYGDNGYSGHDDGTENQCKGVGDAFVIITIARGSTATPSPAAPFDLVFTAVDPNVFPLNPQWAWQRDNNGALPDADHICFPLSGIFSNPSCTTQSPSIDDPSGWNGFWCARGSQHSINGHVNWMPATWQGQIAWDTKSSVGADDDYNINLTPPNGAGLTASSQGFIHTEFDSDETIDHFTTPWWTSFHQTVDRGDTYARAMINGDTAIIVGLAGLDCEHGCATELHPVYAIAIHVQDNPADDVWAIFVRNSGDEGYCSQEQHYVNTNRIAFLIPRPAAIAVSVTTATFLTNNTQSSGPGVSLVSGTGAVVEFGLPDPTAGARINGELHLRWTVGPIGGRLPIAQKRSVAAGSPVAKANPSIESEERLAELERGLTAQKHAVLVSALAQVASKDQLALKKSAAALPKPVRRATLSAVLDAQKAQRDLARAKALCAAYNGSIPGAPSACASVPK